ncbi:MAG TPA: SpoIIE family protein phosphatase [bacterium]|nr:SpoIIE family protein phosphatase [bacterium]
MKYGLAFKAAAFLSGIFICITIAASLIVQSTILGNYSAQRRSEMADLARVIKESIETDPEVSLDSFQVKIIDLLASRRSARILISDSTGKIIYDTERIRVGLFLDSSEEYKIAKRNNLDKFLLRTTDNLKSSYFTPDNLPKFTDRFEDVSLAYFAPLKNNSGVHGQMIITEPMTRLGPSISDARKKMFLFLLAVYLITVSAVVISMQYGIVSPIRKIILLTKKIARNDFSERLELRSSDEIAVLARNFNSMIYSLEKSIREITEQNDGLIHLSSELEARNEELHRKQQFIEYDLRLAHNIQQELLPQVYPNIENILISAANFQVGEIGGDCFDFYKMEDHKLGAFIGDVSGKGIAAALVMSMVTILFSQLKDRFEAPNQILAHVNEIMFRHFGSQHSIYLTCFFLTIDSKTMTLSYSCAGHTPPLLFRPDTGEILNLEAEGFGLGMFGNVSYEEKTMKVKPGDKIILYTDGVTDCRNQQGEMFGHERLVELVNTNPDANSYRLTHFIVEELEDFAGKAARQDDLTLLIIEIKEPGAENAPTA